MRVLVFVWALLASLAGGALAQIAEPKLDDRSTPEKLIQSYYNAINRREFARAYSYLAEPRKQAFEAFEQGFADTVSVDVMTGVVSGDGTAGKMFSSVATSIRAVSKSGEAKFFGGCYNVSEVTATQGANYSPPVIVEGKLKFEQRVTSTEDALPANCDGAEAAVDVAAEADVVGLYLRENSEVCRESSKYRDGSSRPAVNVITFRYSYEKATDPERAMVLYMFECDLFAYNTSQVFYLKDGSGEVSKISFAEPKLDIAYDDQEQTKLKSAEIVGFSASSVLTNAGFNQTDNTIVSAPKWRGVGDSFSVSTYHFVEGVFVLKDYSVDPTTDGEMEPVDLMVNGVLKRK